MKTAYRTIVLGLGGIGAGTLYWLARRGEDVLGIEQFELGHIRGGSQDHSRIIRLSYHTPAYIELAKRAYDAWAGLEADAGEPLILRTGGLDLFPAGGLIPMSDYTQSMRATGVPFEVLDSDALMQRYPQFRLNSDVTTLYQEQSGIAPAAKCNAAHLRMARKHGAQVVENAPVTDIKTARDSIEITAGGTTYQCHKLVICAGAWTNQALACFNRRLPLEITQEQVIYFNSPDIAPFMPDRFPIWIWMDEPCFYGFPVYGENGPKASQDVGGRPVTADTRSFDPDPGLTRRIESFLHQVLPGMPGPHIHAKTCLYTLTPDRDFVIDRLPDHPNVFVAVGAGHAFKFASLFGTILSELVLDGETRSDIGDFKIDRPILLQENPIKTYMI